MKALKPVQIYTENKIVLPLLYSCCINKDIFLRFVLIEVINL
jgi:hypothetical protein